MAIAFCLTRYLGLSITGSGNSISVLHNSRLYDYADSGAWGRMPGITIMLDCAPEKTTLGGLAPVKLSRRPRRRLKKAHNLPSQFSAAGKIGKKREKCYENLVLFWCDAGATGP